MLVSETTSKKIPVTNYGENPYKKTCQVHFQQSWGGGSSIKRTLTVYRTV